MAPRYGLLGRKLGHSYSPQIHRLFADYEYDLVELAPDAVAPFLATTDYAGFNVTIPYKQTVLPLCAELTAVAQKIGAVNTLTRLPQGGWRGDNTDYFGFTQLVTDLAPAGKTVLVLGGDGGTARTATAVLRDLGATLINVSRRGAVNYENVYHHGAAAQIVVNTTPVGMYPHNEATPLELAHFPHLTGAVEVIYNPEKTRFLLAAEKLGVPCRGGLLMLVAQAARARELFDGVKFSPEKIAAVHHHIRNQMRNIVLVGMPGCGKSTVGAALAQALKREFIDTDAVVVARAEMSIPEIFSRWGEADFRRRESEVIAEVGKSAGKVIAVGGGAVLRENNRDALRQNSCVVYLTAPLDALALTGRPLSKSRAEVAKIFAVREPLYSALAEITAPRETAVTEILARLNGNAARI